VAPGPVLATLLIRTAAVLAAVMVVAVIIERAYLARREFQWRYLKRRYAPLLHAALDGDDAALQTLAATPTRHLFALAVLLGEPLIEDRDPARIARTRAIAHAMPLMELADRYLHSSLWWRRAIVLRGLGLIQSVEHTAAIIAALDDDHPDVRAAALDALADLQNPAALPAIVVRLNDATLHRGRRIAVLASFGAACEPYLLDQASIDPEHRVNYARALARCGTRRSRHALSEWTKDERPEVRAAALDALAATGLDDEAATVAKAALEDGVVRVRAAAAHAFQGWQDRGIAARLGPHLDDEWAVAWRAARSLRSMGEAGRPELLKRAALASDLGGRLARQMLWQEAHA
jgi:HEAT repeat protein